MQFSIITPSFRSSEWLKLCIASVADQGVEAEHIVQDSCSDDGTQDWLPRDPRVKAFIEKDAGMYDAINRGLRRANGEILAYLNADEQYLPGALAAVARCFAAHPEAAVVFGDTIIVDRSGNWRQSRRACLPRKYHTWVSDTMGVTSCATFFRRSLLQRGCFFDERL
jgi:glycosyltransferase involved in cell wall biosynthesis